MNFHPLKISASDLGFFLDPVRPRGPFCFGFFPNRCTSKRNNSCWNPPNNETKCWNPPNQKNMSGIFQAFSNLWLTQILLMLDVHGKKHTVFLTNWNGGVQYGIFYTGWD